MMWSREEDMTHDYYHPIAMAKMRAGIDASGNFTGYACKGFWPVNQFYCCADGD
jgi:isoquinoline 1-oxidoreductase beta subunit